MTNKPVLYQKSVKRERTWESFHRGWWRYWFVRKLVCTRVSVRHHTAHRFHVRTCVVWAFTDNHKTTKICKFSPWKSPLYNILSSWNITLYGNVGTSFALDVWWMRIYVERWRPVGGPSKHRLMDSLTVYSGHAKLFRRSRLVETGKCTYKFHKWSIVNL